MPDGYTLLVNSITLNAYRNPAFDVARDPQPTTMIASAPLQIMINPRAVAGRKS